MDLIVHLMLKSQEVESKITLKEQVLALYNFGIQTQDIADVLGKTRNSIDLHLTALRKERKIVKLLVKNGTEKTVPELEIRVPDGIEVGNHE